MSRESLKSGAWSCGSLAVGADACAQIAGLKQLQNMDGEKLKKVLQEWGNVGAETFTMAYNIDDFNFSSNIYQI